MSSYRRKKGVKKLRRQGMIFMLWTTPICLLIGFWYTPFFGIAGFAFIIGILIYFVSKKSELSSPKEDEQKKQILEYELLIYDYIRENQGKAYTESALMKRIEDDRKISNTIFYSRSSLQTILNKLISEGKIKSVQKNGEVYYFF